MKETVITLRQHLPNFITGFGPETATVALWAEAQELPWIKRWSEAEDFHRFSVSREKEPRRLGNTGKPLTDRLMVEMRGGASWFVIAYVESGELAELPDWKQPNKEDAL